MSAARALVAALALSVLAGCTSGGGPDARTDPTTEPTAEATREPAPPDARVGPAVWATRSSPLEYPDLVDVGDGAVLVTDARGANRSSLEVLDPDSGRRMWRLVNPGIGDEPAQVSWTVSGARTGPDGDGGEVVVVPADRLRCPDGVENPDTCGRTTLLEARDAGTGDVRWRWRAPVTLDPSSLLNGAVLDGGAVLLWVGGGILALDAATGERRWAVADVSPAEQVEDGLVLVGNSADRDAPHRLLDLATGEQVRALGSESRPRSLVGSVLAIADGADVRLTDARSGEVLGEVAGSDEVAPAEPRSTDGLAWVTADDELVTLRPGETDPVVAPLPDGWGARDLYLGAFLGEVGGGVVLLPTGEGLRVVGREGGVTGPDGTRALLVSGVAGDAVVLQVAEARDAVEPLEVRRIG